MQGPVPYPSRFTVSLAVLSYCRVSTFIVKSIYQTIDGSQGID